MYYFCKDVPPGKLKHPVMKSVKMKKPIAYTILVFLLSISFHFRSAAQTRDGSFYENLVIDAVEKYDNKDFKGASEILRKVIAGSPENDAAHYYLGLSEFCLDHKDIAESELRTAVQLDSSNFWYRYRLALVYSATDRKELTIKMYEDLLKDFPKKNDLYYNLIELYLSDNQSDRALETLSQIEAVFGRNDATAMTRFQLLGRLGRQEEAYKSLEEYNREYSSPQVLSVLGDYQMSMYNDLLGILLHDLQRGFLFLELLLRIPYFISLAPHLPGEVPEIAVAPERLPEVFACKYIHVPHLGIPVPVCAPHQFPVMHCKGVDPFIQPVDLELGQVYLI